MQSHMWRKLRSKRRNLSPPMQAMLKEFHKRGTIPLKEFLGNYRAVGTLNALANRLLITREDFELDYPFYRLSKMTDELVDSYVELEKNRKEKN